MDIVIKSYNRAYLLDRVLYSIFHFVKNGLGKIYILDDGTPNEYLDILKQKYPSIIIVTSPNYQDKINGKHGNFGAPIQFWRQKIQAISPYFVMMEDDTWFVKEIDLSAFESELEKNNGYFCKLTWWGNQQKNAGKITPISKEIDALAPSAGYWKECIVKNKYFLHSILLKLNLMPKNPFLGLYGFYDVAGHIFRRDFYNFVWPESQTKIEEMIQLGKGAEWYRKQQGKGLFKSTTEFIVTSFVSSSTGAKEKLGFDMPQLNSALNEAWKRSKFDSLCNFPSDFTLDYIASFLFSFTNEEIENWKHWSRDFRSHFIEMGSDLSPFNNVKELNK